MSVTKVDSSRAEQLKTLFNNFRNGEANITKDQLSEIKSNIQANSSTSPEGLTDLIDNYDIIDINGDGISYSEMQTYYTSQGTLTNSYTQSISTPTSFWEEDSDSIYDPLSTGLNKETLVQLKAQLVQSGKEVPDIINQLIDGYSSADEDGSGSLSLDEFKEYVTGLDESLEELDTVTDDINNSLTETSESASSDDSSSTDDSANTTTTKTIDYVG